MFQDALIYCEDERRQCVNLFYFHAVFQIETVVQ